MTEYIRVGRDLCKIWKRKRADVDCIRCDENKSIKRLSQFRAQCQKCGFPYTIHNTERGKKDEEYGFINENQ